MGVVNQTRLRNFTLIERSSENTLKQAGYYKISTYAAKGWNRKVKYVCHCLKTCTNRINEGSVIIYIIS